MSPPEGDALRTELRRRRTRRHRRNRLIRRCFQVAVLGFFSAGLSAIALRHLTPSLFNSSVPTSPDRQQAEATRERLILASLESFRPNETARQVYPYSVVPGGVEDASELKWVAEHDPVVAAHYAGFDYHHARIVRLVLARTAYVSYRKGRHIYWTRRRVTLHKGEKVITDGKITVRARDGNRVEDVPQQAASSSEPPVAKLEEPLRPIASPAMQNSSLPFLSALLISPGMSGLAPTLPLSLYGPFLSARWISLAPRPLPRSGICAPGKKGKEAEAVANSNGKKKKGGCGSGEAAILPEPGTWLLVASGLAGVCWQRRLKLART